MKSRFTALSALALSALLATACTRTGEAGDQSADTTTAAQSAEVPPATAGQPEGAPSTTTAPPAGVQATQPQGPPASGDRADSNTTGSAPPTPHQ